MRKDYVLNNVHRFEKMVRSEQIARSISVGLLTRSLSREIQKEDEVDAYYHIEVSNYHPELDLEDDYNLPNAISAFVQLYGSEAIDNQALTKFCKKHTGLRYLDLVINYIDVKYFMFDKIYNEQIRIYEEPIVVLDINKNNSQTNIVNKEKPSKLKKFINSLLGQ